MTDTLKPCPFCGGIPELPEGIGTQYEIECACGLGRSGVQICDLMTHEERRAGWNERAMSYAPEFVARAREAAIAAWNRRVEPAPATVREGVKVFRICEHCNQEYQLPSGQTTWSFLPCPKCGVRDDPWCHIEVAPSAAADAREFPLELFDSYSVFKELTTWEQQRTSAENVTDVLNATVRLMRKRVPAAAADARDAARYRWLREQHWTNGLMSVVMDPKNAVKLGQSCPSLELLDRTIDAAMSAQEQNDGMA